MSSRILCSGSEACRSLDPKDRLCPRHNEGSRSWLFDPARLWKAGPARNPNPRQAERRLRAWLRPPPLVLFRPDPPAWLRPHIHREIPGDRSLPPTPNPETPSSAAQKSDAQFRLAKSKTPRRPSHGLSMRKPPLATFLANIADSFGGFVGFQRVTREKNPKCLLPNFFGAPASLWTYSRRHSAAFRGQASSAVRSREHGGGGRVHRGAS